MAFLEIFSNMESVRLDEEAVLKTVGCKSLRGSSPWLSAKSHQNVNYNALFDNSFLIGKNKGKSH